MSESFGEAMIKIQTNTGPTQEAIQQVKEDILKMANPRDTQFAGFVKLLSREMFQIPGVWVETAQDREALEQLVARRAYDLVQHAVGYTLEYLHECGDELAAKGGMGSRIQPTIPDITNWKQWGLPERKSSE